MPNFTSELLQADHTNEQTEEQIKWITASLYSGECEYMPVSNADAN